MAIREELLDGVKTALAELTDPLTGWALGAAFGRHSILQLDGHCLDLTVTLPYPIHSGRPRWQQQLESALAARFPHHELRLRTLDFRLDVHIHAVRPGLKPLAGVRNIIAVASGKGGVGKSTVSVNLALALRQQGARVGLLDADIYGPSVPLMLGISGKPESLDGKTMQPLQAHGLKANSIGFLIDDDAPAIWRGPMVSQALEQLLRQTQWGQLDYLMVDMPPGTGDIALTLAQKVPVTGAVIVTTPQDLALADARKGLRMFQKVDVPVLGVVENMSVHICPQCGHAQAIFGEHGGRDMAAEYGVPWLGALPLALSIRQQTDAGCPTVQAAPDSEHAQRYHDIAHKVAMQLAGLPRDYSARMPPVVAR